MEIIGSVGDGFKAGARGVDKDVACIVFDVACTVFYMDRLPLASKMVASNCLPVEFYIGTRAMESLKSSLRSSTGRDQMR